MPQTAPVLHAATGCGGNVAQALNQAAGYLGSGYYAGQALPSTNTAERAAICGKKIFTYPIDILDINSYNNKNILNIQ